MSVDEMGPALHKHIWQQMIFEILIINRIIKIFSFQKILIHRPLVSAKNMAMNVMQRQSRTRIQLRLSQHPFIVLWRHLVVVN